MPYIKREERSVYQQHIAALARLVPKERMSRPGHMNYIISLLLNQVYGSDMRYADHNEIIGLLSSVQAEFYRRYTGPYEDEKIMSEGDLTDM